MDLFRFELLLRRRGTDVSPLDRLVQSALQRIRMWERRHQERSELVKLTELEMHDLGMTRPDAIAEANKPFWRE